VAIWAFATPAGGCFLDIEDLESPYAPENRQPLVKNE